VSKTLKTGNFHPINRVGDRTLMLQECRVIFDISGRDRPGLKLEDLLKLLEELNEDILADDALLLG
jgi:putative tryptophan/tyrosine transport system ATP-binding protein